MTVAMEFADGLNAGRVSAPATVGGRIAAVVNLLRSLGPYMAIELLLPGGSLLALLLWLYRRHRQGTNLSELTPTRG
jgi:hypothetical protein